MAEIRCPGPWFAARNRLGLTPEVDFWLTAGSPLLQPTARSVASYGILIKSFQPSRVDSCPNTSQYENSNHESVDIASPHDLIFRFILYRGGVRMKCVSIIFGFAISVMTSAIACAAVTPSTRYFQYVQDTPSYSLRVCNQTDSKIFVAVAYIPIGEVKFVKVGWYTIRPTECENLLNTKNGDFYAYAEEDGGRRHWGGHEFLCVPHTAFHMASDSNRRCDSTRRQGYYFKLIDATTEAGGDGVVTWTLVDR